MKEAVDRRMSNNHGELSRDTWEKIWIKFNDLYQEPNYTKRMDELIYIEPNQTTVNLKIEGLE
jgi:hypothetical protein